MNNVERLLDILVSNVGDTELANKDSESLYALEVDSDIIKTISRGELLDVKFDSAFICDHPDGTCHQAVAYEYHNNSEDGDKVFTGMALKKGKWFRHSWIVDANKNIVEPCTELADDYFGFALTEQERDEFIKYWGQTLPVWAKTDEEIEQVEYLIISTNTPILRP